MSEQAKQEAGDAFKALERRLFDTIAELRKQFVSGANGMRSDQVLSLAVLGHNLVNQQASAAVLNLAVSARAAGSLLSAATSDDAVDEILRRSVITQR